MSSFRRGVPGAGASNRTCGSGLCVLSWWPVSRPMPRTFISGSSRCRPGPIRSRFVVAAVRGRAPAPGHSRPAEAHGAPHAPGARCGVGGFLAAGARSLWLRIAAAPALEWQLVLVAGWPPVALLLSVELLVHRPVDRLDVTAGQRGEGDGHAKSGRLKADGDPLLPRARMVDARHRELHQRPASAETPRKELRIGARRSRQLAALVRENRSGSDETGVSRNRANEARGRRSGLVHDQVTS